MPQDPGEIRDYETLVAHAPICIHEIDLDGRVTSINPAGLAIIGLPIEEVLNHEYLDIIGEHNLEVVGPLFEDARRNGKASTFEFTVDVDGETRHLTSGFVPMYDENGELIRLMGLTEDISAQVHALQTAQRSEARFRDLAETAAEFFWEVDADLQLVWATGELGEQWAGFLAATGGNGSLPGIEEDAGRLQLLDAVQNTEPFSQIDLVHEDHEGSVRTVALSGKPIFDDAGELAGWRGSGSDVTAARALAARLSYQATHDELTGLLNRREFSGQLGRLVAASPDAWPTDSHVLCFIDLDQFKVVNDTCGHVAGDELLRQVSGLLRAHIRGTDLFARLGGDEFGIIMHGASVDDAKRLLSTIHDALADWRFEWGDRVFSIGASVGVVALGADSGTVDQILAAADTACYAAKDQGRNRCVVFSATDADISRRRGEIDSVSRITRALDHDGFRLFAQPVVSINHTGPPRHFEVLVRMVAPDGVGIVPPSDFLPAAEQFGLANRLDLWVIEHTLEALDAAPGILTFAVNLSGDSLGRPGFLTKVSALLDASDVDPGRVCFEITETAAITNVGHATAFIATLRARGCRFALDDFGSGLASCSYLKNLDVDFLKIDGSFVKNLLTDPVDYALVRSISDIGKQMGKTIIAEWVETAEIHAKLAELGVDMVQGWHVGHPEPIENLLG